VTLMEPGLNTGYAAGNNLGISASHEEYVLLLNPDTEVQPGAIETLARYLDSRSACGVVAPQLFSPGGAIQRSCRSFPTPIALAPELLGISRVLPSLGSYRLSGFHHDSARQVDQPMGSALLVRRQMIEQAGLMDEQFPLFFNEVDWLYRAKQHGWEVWFVPEARVLHHLGASTRQIRVRAAWQSHTGLHAFYRKHFRGRLHPLLYALVIGAIYAHGAVVVIARLIQQLVSSRRNSAL
ncbi:MAG: glycosyltransferase family 2 protein, partial [Chloroflexi bacterium]|nr:glycosyltransferase family 2 protein [Chloroflexota bacterium]